MTGTPTRNEWEITAAEDELIGHIARAIDDMPILERLRLAKNLVFDRDGDKGNIPSEGPQDARSIMAVEILDGVIKILKQNPRAAKLSKLEL